MRSFFLAISSLLLFLGGTAPLLAQHRSDDTMVVTLDEVQVTALRHAAKQSEQPRAVQVLTRAVLTEAGAVSLDDALRLSAVVDVRRRGPFGAQSDIGMRGSTFGQNLILIDGMRANDPQTGHHALALALPTEEIERVEIVPGHMSALHGADAFGGLINIVTRRAERNALSMRLAGGSFGRADARLSWSAVSEHVAARTSAQFLRHDGYSRGTDFTGWTLSHVSNVDAGGTGLRLSASYSDKDFGAFDFYSPGRGIPSRERIHGGSLAVQARRGIAGAVLQGGVSYRRLNDRFVFDSRTPDRFVNTHATDVLNGDLVLYMQPSTSTQWNVGVNAQADRIRSTALGDHGREGAAAFTGLRQELLPWLALTAELRVDALRGHEAQWNPAMGLQCALGQSFTAYVSGGRSFRQPSYTELYYRDPVSSGSDALHAETAWSAEIGARGVMGALQLSSALFLRDQRELIDFILDPADNRYYARNLRKASVHGAELRWEWTPSEAPVALLAHYQYVYSALEGLQGMQARYALTHPRHKASLLLRSDALASTPLSIAAVYARPFAQGDAWTTVDVRIRHALSRVLEIDVTVENIFDTRYEEIPGIPMPGRWITAGLHIGMPGA